MERGDAAWAGSLGWSAIEPVDGSADQCCGKADDTEDDQNVTGHEKRFRAGHERFTVGGAGSPPVLVVSAELPADFTFA